mgnify:CR=1 FL=1
MKRVICPICNSCCSKYGKTNAGTQRWFCGNCKMAFSPKIDNLSKQLNIFLKWLFSKDIQKDMPGQSKSKIS